MRLHGGHVQIAKSLLVFLMVVCISDVCAAEDQYGSLPPSPAAAESSLPQTSSEDRIIQKGDSIVISVKRHSDMDRVVTVSSAGDVDLPLIGRLKVDGMPMSRFKDMLTASLSDYIKNPEVEINPAYGAGSAARMVDEDAAKITRVFSLKNSDAVTLAESLRGIVSSRGTINPDKSSNTLIVSDTESYIEGIAKIIHELEAIDKKTPQVVIEAEIVELTVNDGRDFSLDAFMQNISHDNFIGKYNTQIAIPSVVSSGNSGSIGRNITNVSDIMLSQLGDGGNFFMGTVWSKTKYSGYVNAMVELNKAKVLARPRVIVENNQRANIQIVTSFPYRELSGSGIVLGSNSYVFTTKFLDYGILMPVTPQIKANGMVNLLVEPEVSFIKGFSDNVPIRVARRASTQVNVANNSTLVIGGLINEQVVNRVKKVPVVGDLPIVGNFFRSQTTDTEKTELIIFVTPRILDDVSTKTMVEKNEADKERMIKTKIDSKPFKFDFGKQDK